MGVASLDHGSLVIGFAVLALTSDGLVALAGVFSLLTGSDSESRKSADAVGRRGWGPSGSAPRSGRPWNQKRFETISIPPT